MNNRDSLQVMNTSTGGKKEPTGQLVFLRISPGLNIVGIILDNVSQLIK